MLQFSKQCSLLRKHRSAPSSIQPKITTKANLSALISVSWQLNFNCKRCFNFNCKQWASAGCPMSSAHLHFTNVLACQNTSCASGTKELLLTAYQHNGEVMKHSLHTPIHPWHMNGTNENRLYTLHHTYVILGRTMPQVSPGWAMCWQHMGKCLRWRVYSNEQRGGAHLLVSCKFNILVNQRDNHWGLPTGSLMLLTPPPPHGRLAWMNLDFNVQLSKKAAPPN